MTNSTLEPQAKHYITLVCLLLRNTVGDITFSCNDIVTFFFLGQRKSLIFLFHISSGLDFDVAYHKLIKLSIVVTSLRLSLKKWKCAEISKFFWLCFV